MSNADHDVDQVMQLGSAFVADLVRALDYHRWLIVATTLGAVLTSYGAMQFVSEEYESTARLLVKLGRENVEVPVSVEKGGLISNGVRKEDINSEIQMLSARSQLEAAVDALGPEAFKMAAPPPQTLFQKIKFELRRVVRWAKAQFKELSILLNLRPRLSEREEAVTLVQKALRVEREKDSDVISIAARLPSAELAMQVVDTVVKLYLERRVEVRRERGMSSFFDEQLQTLRDQLRLLDASRLQLRDGLQISTIGEERSLLLSRLQLLRKEAQSDEGEMKLLRLPAGATADAAAQARLSSQPNHEQLRAKVTELRIRRTELLQRFKEDAEAVQRVDREIAQIETTLRQSIEAQLGERRTVAAGIETRLRALNHAESELDRIERDRAVVLQTFQTYAKRSEEARVSEALDLRRVSNIAVLNPAERPIEAVSPRKLLMVGLALPLGLLVGLALALFLEYLNQTIRDERDLGGADRGLFLGRLRITARRS
nr:Wzz/FepE/Etk N-terminal domain-containing protein [uncultured Roseateles sp.]